MRGATQGRGGRGGPPRGSSSMGRGGDRGVGFAPGSRYFF